MDNVIKNDSNIIMDSGNTSLARLFSKKCRDGRDVGLPRMTDNKIMNGGKYRCLARLF